MRRWLALLAAVVVVAGPVDAASPTDAAKARERLRSLKRELNEKRAALRQLDDKTRSLLLTVDELDRALHEVEARVEAATAREAEVRAEVEVLERALASEVLALESVQARLRRRLRAIYVLGEGAVARAMVGVERFEDVAARRRLMQELGSTDARLFRKHRELVLSVEGKRDQVSKRLSLAQQLKAEVEEERELVMATRQERQAAIERIDLEKELAVRAVRENVAEQRELSVFLGEILRRSPPRKRRGPGVLQAGLAQPVDGTIIRRFGTTREQGTGARLVSNGMHLRAAKGSPVKAAASGVIAHQGWIKGFGLMVIVDHEEGHHTLYAHLSRAFVQGGDRVDKGQLIGHVGDTGSLHGPKLYFELRAGGRPINPAPYLRK